MERMYSKRELDTKFKSAEEKNDAWCASILEKLDDMDKYRLTPMLEQARITNGRVSSLEKWRTWLTGAAVVFLLVAGFFFKEYLPSKIDMAVEERFNNWESYELPN